MNNELRPLEPGCIALVLAGPDAGKVTGVIACEGKEVAYKVSEYMIWDLEASEGQALWEITDKFGFDDDDPTCRFPYMDTSQLMRIDGISEEDAESESLQMYLDSAPYPTMFSYIHRITKGADDDENSFLHKWNSAYKPLLRSL